MIDRLRFLLDRPLDPLAARAVIVLASAILLGFTAVFALGASESDRSAPRREQAAFAQPQLPRSVDAARGKAAPPVHPMTHRPRQDPQDQKGSPAGKRATKVLRAHRALQYIPYRQAGLSIQLVGAQGGRAVLAVSAPTIPVARHGWLRFLRRYRDSGRAYLPRFEATGGHRG